MNLSNIRVQHYCHEPENSSVLKLKAFEQYNETDEELYIRKDKKASNSLFAVAY